MKIIEEMLETTFGTKFIPGTNVRGEVAGASWTYLLPNLQIRGTLCIGAPSKPTLATLSRLSEHVLVMDRRRGTVPKSEPPVQKGRSSNIVLNSDWSEVKGDSVDLIVINGWRKLSRISQDQSLLDEIQRVLIPGGMIYFDYLGPLTRLKKRTLSKILGSRFDQLQVYWQTPLIREVHTAVPMQDEYTVNYFYSRRIYSPVIRFRAIMRAERAIINQPIIKKWFRRYGVLISDSKFDFAEKPPRYLREIASEQGVDIEDFRWGLSARGKYSSRKVLIYLFKKTSQTPEYIVKLTRDCSLNYRLENECRALSSLWKKGVGDEESLPRVVFSGHHANLALVGETVVRGVPFRKRTEANRDCPYASAAIDWLIDLSAQTVDYSSVTAAEASQKLMNLYGQLNNIYHLTKAERIFLEKQIYSIGDAQDQFPLVFQHGDPGTWNLIVTNSGKVAFLDWEAAEFKGMGLWDLFYFLRSFCTWSARTHGIRDSLDAVDQNLFAAGNLSELVLGAVENYINRTSFPVSLIEPMFYTCWMHRALKQATRLKPGKLGTGHYIRLLKLSIRKRNSLILDRLFSISG